MRVSSPTGTIVAWYHGILFPQLDPTGHKHDDESDEGWLCVSRVESEDQNEAFQAPPCHKAQPVLELELKCKGIKLTRMGNLESTDLITNLSPCEGSAGTPLA